MKRYVVLPLLTMAIAVPVSANTAPATVEAQAPSMKQPIRKGNDTRERKRVPSTSVGRGCMGCIVPLDGIAATMAVRHRA